MATPLEPAFDSASASVSCSQGAGAVVREMRRRFRRGERPRAEELLAAAPDLQADPEAAIDVVYEEFCLRQGSGEHAVADDLCRRFPAWQTQLRLMFECHQMLAAEPPARPPEVGETVGGFHLQAVLGRGSRGTVFLATETELGDRPVVVKFTPDQADEHEHLSLARAQHTHIMPLYSARRDPTRGERILCMPYFGGTTLARVLAELRDIPVAARTGRHVLTVLDEHSRLLPPPAGPLRRSLELASYEQAICLTGACVAEALQYAHERGLVHLDVKPANVLLAADGQPLLLDFHLARPPFRGEPAEPTTARGFGGTLAYMPPEQTAAYDAAQAGRLPPRAVDERADVFALGATLYEAFGGTVPFRPGESPALSEVHPHFDRGLSRLVARCLSPDPAARFADAGAVATALRQHLRRRSPPHREPARRWRWLFAGVTSLVLLSVALVLGSRPAAPPESHIREELHRLAERVRRFPTPHRLPSAQSEQISQRCRELVARREQLLALTAADLAARSELLTDLETISNWGADRGGD